MKKLHICLMTVLVVMMALVMAVAVTGCGSAETPDGGDTGGSGNGGSGVPATQSKGLDFEKIEDTETYAVVGLGSCKDSKVVIPATYKNKPVVTINATAFAENCGSVTEIYVPDSIKTIESGAFSGCSALQKLTIPVLSGKIGVYFGGANTSVPSTLKAVILTTMTAVPEYAFESCTSLEEVEFPTNATEIGWASLKGCKNVKKLTTPFVGTTNVYYFDGTYQRARKAKNDFICNSTVIINNSESYTAHLYNYWAVNVYYNGGYHFGTSAYGGDFEELIPAEITSLTITNGYVTDRACWQSNVKNVAISGTSANEAKGVGKDSFYECHSLSSVTLSNEIAEMGESAFYQCRSLTSVTLPNGLKELQDYVFWNCSSLSSITLPSGLKEIKDGAFRGCTSLKALTIPEGVTTIGYGIIDECNNLVNLSIPSSLIKCDPGSFTGAEKLSYRICDNGKYLGNDKTPCIVLMGVTDTSITSFTMPNSVLGIHSRAFKNCAQLKTITMSSKLLFIGGEAFYGCRKLESVRIPMNVNFIGSYVFYDCYYLTSLVFENPDGWCEDWGIDGKSTISSSDLRDSRTAADYIRSGGHNINPWIRK